MTSQIFIGNLIFYLRRLVLAWVFIPHQSFLRILCYTLFSIIQRIGFGNRKLTHFLQIYKKIDSNSNNVVLAASTQVATLTVAQVSVMPTAMPISVSPKKKNQRSLID